MKKKYTKSSEGKKPYLLAEAMGEAFPTSNFLWNLVNDFIF